MLPQHIKEKINRLYRYLNKAYLMEHEIEKWAEKQGIDIYSREWADTAVDDFAAVKGISEEGLKELLGAVKKTQGEAKS